MAEEFIKTALNKRGRIVNSFVSGKSPDGRLELLIPDIGAENQFGGWYLKPKARHGKEWVEVDEDPQILRDYATKKGQPVVDEPIGETGGSNA